jgi:hypothetical protein
MRLETFQFGTLEGMDGRMKIIWEEAVAKVVIKMEEKEVIMGLFIRYNRGGVPRADV